MRGEGECGRGTEGVILQGSERLQEGYVARFHDDLGSPLPLGLRPSFGRKASEGLFGQPVSLQAGASGGWRVGQLEWRGTSDPPQLGQRGPGGSGRL